VTISVKLIEDQALWDRFVEASPDGTVFHRWELLHIVERHSGYRLLPYGVYRGNELMTLFPLFHRKDPFFSSVFAPPPQTCVPYLGPLMSGPSSRAKPSTRESYLHTAVREVDAEIRKLAPNYVYLQLPPGHYDIRPYKWQDYREVTNFTYLIDISRPQEQILASFDQNARRFIRDAGGLGLEVRRSFDTGTFCDVMRKRYAEMGLTFPLLSPGYLKDLLEAFPAEIQMYFLCRGDEIVSLIVVSLCQGRMIYWIGNARTGSNINGNEYLIWELIKKAKEEGCTGFEIQGAGDQRLWKFKSKFNPQLEVCYALCQKDRRGHVAEWAYRHIKRKVLA
jgi:hypothetical protein